MLILAHRGASADAPENTLRAFREAVAQGADGVELDVMRCGSGELVVCHDERLGRLTGRDVEVRTTPLEELRRLDVGGHLGFGEPAAIPTLEEVLAALPPGFLVNIELKCGGLGGGLHARVGELVERAGLGDRIIVSSFNPFALARLAVDFPALRRGFLIDQEGPFWLQDALGTALVAGFSIHPHHGACTGPRVRRWAAAGLKVVTWTVDEPLEAARLRDLGVEYCITNRPRALREGLAALRVRPPG